MVIAVVVIVAVVVRFPLVSLVTDDVYVVDLFSLSLTACSPSATDGTLKSNN